MLSILSPDLTKNYMTYIMGDIYIPVYSLENFNSNYCFLEILVSLCHGCNKNYFSILEGMLLFLEKKPAARKDRE